MIITNNELSLRKPVSLCTSVAAGLDIGRMLIKAAKAWEKEQTRLKAVGLAAPQIGILKAVCVIRNDRLNIFETLVNPKIVSHSDVLVKQEEQCISFPTQKVITYRHLWVEVACLNWAKTRFFGRYALTGNVNEGVIVQHEIAHITKNEKSGQNLLMFDFQKNKSWCEATGVPPCLTCMLETISVF